MLYKNMKKGFTLVETLVGVAVFTVISLAAYQAYISLFKIVSTSQYRIIAINLANEQFEILRNLPYSDVGVIGGAPNGKFPHVQELVRGGYTFIATTTIRNIDLPFDGTIGGTPNDLSPADNKVVEIEIGCPTCENFTPVILTSNIAPKNLETASTNGALFIKVFDAAGAPVADADVSISNDAGTTTIVDVTNKDGILQIIDITPAIEAYNIIVSKNGYSTDRTYKNSETAPGSSLKLPSSVLLQQVTQTSFSIDKTSTLNLSSVTPSCTPVPSFDFKLQGSKKIGQNPDVYKYIKTLSTDSSGQKTVSNLEWDTYRIINQDSDYDIVGVSPVNPFSVLPDSNQDVKIILANSNPKTLVVSVKDSSTLLPISGAEVTLDERTKITGKGSKTITDWSSGEDNTDGNIDYSSTPGELKLLDNFGQYPSSGVLESTVFDTGSQSNFDQLIWKPEFQPAQAGENSVYFQIATAASSSGPWIYRGPDAATSSYYISPNSTINSIHNGDRYIRYKMFMQTASATSTPTISDISYTYTTQCTPPGQVYFNNLDNGDYTITISKDGYADATVNVNINSNWKEQEVLLIKQ